MVVDPRRIICGASRRDRTQRGPGDPCSPAILTQYLADSTTDFVDLETWILDLDFDGQRGYEEEKHRADVKQNCRHSAVCARVPIDTRRAASGRGAGGLVGAGGVGGRGGRPLVSLAALP